ncbi:MAG: BrnA antitoxin family protein [Acidobacteria bacterium]|nr:BrnA antitoxin family protein [Acidobacteriota bacterium]
MASVKSKPKKRRDPLPEHFGSPEEAADFWDTHDSADYEDYMSDVECQVNIKRRAYMISLDSDLYGKLRAIAKDRGVKPETLVNLWIQEKAS